MRIRRQQRTSSGIAGVLGILGISREPRKEGIRDSGITARGNSFLELSELGESAF